MMAVLNIRNLPDVVRDRLRVRAARAGRSIGAEAREILTAVCCQDEKTSVTDLQSWVDRLYKKKPKHVVKDLIDERRRENQRRK